MTFSIFDVTAQQIADKNSSGLVEVVSLREGMRRFSDVAGVNTLAFSALSNQHRFDEALEVAKHVPGLLAEKDPRWIASMRVFVGSCERVGALDRYDELMAHLTRSGTKNSHRLMQELASEAVFGPELRTAYAWNALRRKELHSMLAQGRAGANVIQGWAAKFLMGQLADLGDPVDVLMNGKRWVDRAYKSSPAMCRLIHGILTEASGDKPTSQLFEAFLAEYLSVSGSEKGLASDGGDNLVTI